MSQLNTFGRNETAEPGEATSILPQQGTPIGGGVAGGAPGAGGPGEAEAGDGARSLKPIHLAGVVTGGLVLAGGLAWFLLGGSSPSDVAAPTVTTSVAPSDSASISAAPSVTTSPGAGIAGRNPFAGAGTASAGGASADGGVQGGAVTVTATTVQSVTSTVTVPVVSTVTATSTKLSTVTSTVTAQPVYAYVKTWAGSSGTLIVNSDEVSATTGGTVNGVAVSDDANTTDTCVLLKVAGAADSSRKRACAGDAVQLS